MKKIKQALRRFVSLTLVFALVLDQNIVNAQVSSQQSKFVEQNTTEQTDILREKEKIDSDSQDANSDEEKTDASDTEIQTEAVFVNEITDERSENSKQYIMSDKSVTVVMYDEAVHFEDEDGNLVEIDNSLVKTDAGYTNGANTYDVVFHDDDETRGKVDFEEDGYGISWQLLETKDNSATEQSKENNAEENRRTVYAYRANRAERPDAENDTDAEEASDTEKTTDGKNDTDTEKTPVYENEDSETIKAVAADSEISDITDYEDEKEFGYAAKQSSILFDGFTNDVSIEYIPQNDGIKENIIMNNKTVDYVHHFSISLKGLTATLTDENEVIFYDAETGEQKYYFPAPYMVDAEGNISYDVVYRIDTEEEDSSAEESNSEEENSEETGSEESSSAETGSEENSSAEESSAEEISFEESSTKQDDAEDEKSPAAPEEESKTEQIEKDEDNVEEETEESTTTPPKGLTLSGSAGTPAKESEPEAETDEETKAEEKPKTVESKESEEETETRTEPESETEPETQEQDTQDSEQEQTVTISIIPDSDWLETASYPVTIDPLLKKVNGVNEITKVSINSADTTRDTTTLKVGATKGVKYRSFVKFDLPTLPKNCIITAAELTSAGVASDGVLYIEAHMVGKAWQPGTISWSNQPQEASRLLDYAPNHSYFNITKAVREWYEGTSPNYGIMFKAYDEDNVQFTKNISFKAIKSKPYLKLNYIIAGGTENYWTTHRAAAGTAGAAYINDYLGYLTVVNTDVQTAGSRMPMNIQHIYNSCQTDTDIGAGYGWRLNYQQTLKIPTDTVDVTEYPYVWTDEDGTQHYFKKKGVTILQNGADRGISTGEKILPAADEDGLGLYVVFVNDAALKNQYPLKLTDKSGSVCRYFDKMGRLAMIADSNQYENGKNSSSKEKNCIKITYEDAGAKADTAVYDEALVKLNELKDAYNKNLSLDECTKVYNNVIPYIEKLRKDIYAVSDYETGKKVHEAYIAVETAEDSNYYSTKSAQAKKAIDAVTKAKDTAAALKAESGKRIKSITDAVGNTAVISYDANGRISAVTNPSAPNNGAYNKTASAKHTYQYTNGNLTGIRYSNGKTAAYTYDANRNLIEMSDHTGYHVNYAYNNRNRITQVSETGSSDVSGQKYTITYNSDNTNQFRFSGANDIYGDNDDVINTYVFDEKGKALSEYSVLKSDTKTVIGAIAVTYDGDEQDGTDTAKNKIKDSAVVGAHSMNYLTNHSFELADISWSIYTKDISGTLNSAAVSAKSTKKRYIGLNGAYFDQTKATQGTIGLKQSLTLKAGTYTLSGYAALDGATASKAYLEAAAGGKTYRSDTLTGTTAQEFDNGWQRLYVTFTLTEEQTVEVRTAVECTASKGVGNVAFDCLQLEDGDTANSYNILEDGSFERKSNYTPVQLGWAHVGNGSAEDDDYAFGSANTADGENSYHIVSEPGKNKSFTFTTNLGPNRSSFALTGWIKANTTPIRQNRELYVKAKHDTPEGAIAVKQKLNAYSEGWQYFCLMMPSKIWANTTISIQFDDNIGDLYIDGLELTKNDVQTRVYNANGKMTSKHVEQKDTTYGYDNYDRRNRMTSPGGAVSTYTYDKNNDNIKITTSPGPNVYMTYDKYGNLLTTATYDAYVGTAHELYTQNRYTDDGNFQSASVDNRGYTTSYVYDKATGNLTSKTLPKRSGTETKIGYSYNVYGLLTVLKEGDRSVGYGYDDDGNLTSITRNGFKYEYTYDDFGNVVKTKIAGKTVSENSYAANNGMLTGTTYADGSRTSADHDEYGRVIRSYITDAGGSRYQIDSTVYDNDGNIKRYTDTANNLTTEYDYDDAGRVARSVVKKENDSAYNGSRVQYAYSTSGKIENLSYDTGDGTIKSYVYTYAKDDAPIKSVFPDGSSQTLNYDTLRRNNERIYFPVKNAALAKRLYTTAEFAEGEKSVSSHKGTTTLIKTYTNKFGNGTTNKTSEFTYTYDEWGNITGVTENVGGNKGAYTYNNYGELTKAVEKYSSGTYTYDYTYDSGENIKTEKVTGPSGTKTHTYTYDSVWKDKLISYDGKSITYDAMGNPLNYMDASMTWDVKGNLTSVSGRNGKSADYTYLSDGQRYTKTTGGKTTTYLYNNGLLLSETTGNEVINYYYDSNGTILGVGYKKGTSAEKNYFFEKNAFGDVIAVYRNSDSVLIGTYEYDLWGNPISVKEAASGRDTDGILQKNPFRYRCYYYDTETGFYYLNSRYYDPQTRRFISADDRVLQTGENAKGYNLYSYCQNSPVGAVDYDGHLVDVAVDLLFIVVVAVCITMIVFPPPEVKKKIDEGIAELADIVDKETHQYIVYTLRDKETKEVKYVGRTKNYKARMWAHQHSEDKKNLEDEIIASDLTYVQARGIEQSAMMYYHTIKSEDGLNKINGVDLKKKKKATIYMREAKKVAGFMFNEISNDALNALGI